MSRFRDTLVFYGFAFLLFLSSSALAFYFWKKSENAAMERDRQAAELQGLELEKSMIERQLDSTAVQYLTAWLENEDLRGKTASNNDFVNQKDTVIRQLKGRTYRNLQELSAQVEKLRNIKIEYETTIAILTSENEQLRAANRRLSGENDLLRGRYADLSGRVKSLTRQLEAQILQTQCADFKASAFRVEVTRRDDKLTVRSRKARTIYVRFDLADVPEMFWGVHQFYLSVTDDKGRPVFSENPGKIIVQAPTGPAAIIYQQTKQTSLTETQRLSFTCNLDERLKSGHYVVAIYCEAGLLGVSSFRLI